MKKSLLLLALLVTAGSNATAQVSSSPSPQQTPQTEVDKALAKLTEPVAVEQIALRYRQAKDVENEARAWKRLVELRPHRGHYKYELAALYAQRDEKSLAYNALLELQAQGYAYDLQKDARFAPVATTEAWEYIVKGYDANRAPFGEGKVAHTLPKQDLLIESLAWDPTRKRLLVGSAREGSVSIVDDKGGLKRLVRADADNGLWAVFDVAVDAQRGVLWVASTAVPHFKGYKAESDLGRAGVFKFDLKTGKFLKRFLSPTIVGQSFFMSSLAVAPDGTVFAADGVNNAVYMIRDDQLKRLFHVPVLGSIRGMTVSDDGRVLYFADHERGLFGFELASGKPFEVAVPPKLALGGIDGLTYWRKQLVIVQSDMVPRRIMRLKLAPDGRSIVGVQPLEANRPELSLPTFATRDGDRLLVLANSQKANYDRFGLLRDRNKLEATRIFALDLNFGQAEAAKPE